MLWHGIQRHWADLFAAEFAMIFHSCTVTNEERPWVAPEIARVESGKDVSIVAARLPSPDLQSHAAQK